MTMIAQLSVLACACALSLADFVIPPLYTDYQIALDQAYDTLFNNVLALDGAVPLLDDHRRHFTQIINVINNGGHARSGCLVPDYDSQYPNIVNESLAQGLANPQAVVNDIRELVERIRNETEEITEIVKKAEANDERDINEFIADMINERDDLKLNNDIYLAAGEAAKALLAKEQFISSTSHQFNTTTFAVLDEARVLKDVIDKTADVYRQLQYKDRIHC